MRVVFFGSPSFAVPTLQMLIDARYDIPAVVTQPDKPAGRGLRLTPPAVKEHALAAGLNVLQPKSVRTPEFEAELRALAPDVAVVVAYGRILPANILSLPRHGCLNVHASLLPKYRGAAPIQWAIVNGETRTGISIMQLDEGMDTGPIIAMEPVDILEDDDAYSLANMLSAVGADEMRKVLARLAEHGRLEATPQEHALATNAPLIKREDGRIDWSASAERIILLIRGFMMWPKAWTTLNGRDCRITAADACAPEWIVREAVEDPRVEPGTVVDVVKGAGIAVKAGGGSVLIVKRAQPEGKAEMGGLDLINGGYVKIGSRFGA